MITYRHLEVELVGDVAFVNFRDRKLLDEVTIQLVGEELFSLADEGSRKIVLNFSRVEYLSSAALGKLITLHKKVMTAGGILRLCNINPQIYEVFQITHLNKLFTIFKDENEALELL